MANPWPSRSPLHFAHQGGALEAPSSTLFAMRLAVRNHDADALELDVHRSADGHLVVCHDESVDRTTPHTGTISQFTLEELRTFDNAFWWAPGYEATTDLSASEYVFRGRAPEDSAFGIATVEEILQEFPNTFLNFDIKEIGPTRYESQLADLLRAYGRQSDVIVASFHDDALRVFHQYAPDIHVSLGPTDTVMFYDAAVNGARMPTFDTTQVALQIPPSFDGTQIIDAAFVTAAHNANLAVHAWTIDDPEQMHQLLDCNVDGIMTDRPSVLAEVLRRRRS